MKPSQEIESLCKKLKPVIGDQADKLWHMYLAEDEQNRRKFALDIEIMAEKFLKEEPLESEQILLTPPEVKDSKGQYLLGDIMYNKNKLQQLNLKPEDFLKQVGIFAITGEGKTNLAYLLALQLVKSKTPFMVIDWKRSWRNLLSLKDKHPELNDVKVLTIGRDILPFLWNVFRAPPGTDKEFWVGAISDALERSHLSGPGVAYYFNKIYSKLFKELPEDFCPNFFDGIRELKNIKVYGREANWKQTALRIFQSFTLGKAKRVFNTRKPIKLEDLLDKPVILELDLEMPKPLRMFFSEIILRWIHLYRLTQGETDKLKHVLFLEEVHNLFAQNSFVKSSNSLENLYREIRGFGEGIVSITQHPSLLPIELLGNCHTQIYLGLQHADDIETARKSLFLNYEEDPYFNILNVGECIVKIKNRVEPCLVKTPLVPVQKELVTDGWLKTFSLGSQFWRYSWKVNDKDYLSLQKDVQDILDGKAPLNENTLFKVRENTPGDFQGKIDGNISVLDGNTLKRRLEEGIFLPVNSKQSRRKKPKKFRPQHRLLIDILNHPFSTITQRYKRLKLHSKLGNKCRKDLIADKCVMPRKITTGKGWITLFELTRKGKMVLGDLGHEFKNESEGVVHKFWKHKVSGFYKKAGLDVRVEEYYVNGRPDIIVNTDEKKIAIEIETGKSNYVGNIERALEAGFDEVICVAINRFVEDKICRRLEEKGVLDERVRIVGIRGF
jgi:Helicase HerA-like C-terminal/Helicase HerA, central domain